MKICLCGKGGSGKSTVTVLLAQAFKRCGREPIVLDADESNASLFWMLGLQHPPQPLMDYVGGKKDVQQKMIARFAKGEGEPAMSIWQMKKITCSDLPPDYLSARRGIKLIASGKIHHALEGCACPMGVVTREFLKKFETARDEIMLVDMEAGIEHFGRGVEASVDGVVSVVEPSLESIALAQKVMSLTQAAGATYYGAVLNKIASAEQRHQVKKRLTDFGVAMIGAIGVHDAIQSACLQGKPIDEGVARAETEEILKVLAPDAQRTTA